MQSGNQKCRLMVCLANQGGWCCIFLSSTRDICCDTLPFLGKGEGLHAIRIKDPGYVLKTNGDQTCLQGHLMEWRM